MSFRIARTWFYCTRPLDFEKLQRRLDQIRTERTLQTKEDLVKKYGIETKTKGDYQHEEDTYSSSDLDHEIVGKKILEALKARNYGRKYHNEFLDLYYRKQSTTKDFV